MENNAINPSDNMVISTNGNDWRDQYRAIEAAINDYLISLRVSFTVNYVGEVYKDDWNGQLCDQWRVSFTDKIDNRRMSTSFFTGIGSRKDGKPEKPKAASVLHSLLMDTYAIDSSFEDWCSDYGYDTDSIKALKTYKACRSIGERMVRVFSTDTIDAMREILQDY